MHALKIIQLTDLHLFTDPNQCIEKQLNTRDTFQAVIDHVLAANLNPDWIMLTGDLIHDDKVSTYDKLAQQLQHFKIPIYWLMGNHDIAEITQVTALQTPPFNTDKIIVDKHWACILLNSAIPGTVPGYLNANELKRLKDFLSLYPKHHILISIHHPPTAMEKCLTNEQAFWDIVKPYPQVKICLFGHIHQEYDTENDGVRLLGSPSTCFQFNPNTQPISIDNKPPGYRYLELWPDGHCTTTIYWVK